MPRCGIFAIRKSPPWRRCWCDRDDQQTVVSAGLGYRAEGIAWRLGQGRTPEDVAESPDEICGPDALAAFYRRSAIESVGGFSSSPVAVVAAIDMALSLERAGFRCIVEPTCLAQVDAAAVRDKPGFRHGRDAERLFWQWASAHGRARSVAAHAALLAGECVIGVWRPFMLMHLAGRAVGAICAALGKRLPKSSEAADNDEPSIIAMPQVAEPARRKEQRSTRAA